MSEYFQIFSYQAFSLNDLKERLYFQKPRLIEWIHTEEYDTSSVPEWNILTQYLDDYPDARLHILVGSLDPHMLPQRNQVLYESYALRWICDANRLIKTNGIHEKYLPIPKEFIPRKFRYKFISFFNRGGIVRCNVIDKFAEYKMIQHDTLISWNGMQCAAPGSYTFKYFNGEKIVISGDSFRQNDSFDAWRLPPSYYDAAFSVIVETTQDHMFITEKTTIPITYNKPFLILGGPRFNLRLRDELGFKIFEEVFDYSFDEEVNINRKINKFVDEVKKLHSMSLDELSDLYLSIKDKIIYNKERLISILDDKNLHPKKVIEWKKYLGDESVTIEPKNRVYGFINEIQHLLKE